jgi:hypothetical protein
MTRRVEPILDHFGQIMFICSSCGEPLTADDFFHLGLRQPNPGETREEYAEAELIEAISHDDCLRAARAS